MMRYRVFGDTGWRVSELGMGCAALGGGLYQKNDREAIATLNEALDAGMNFFDTASNYSVGRSERLIDARFSQCAILRRFGECLINFVRHSFRRLTRSREGLDAE